MLHQKLAREFYARNTHTVAKDLLGKSLVRRWRGKKLVARINEVESYVGEDDLASHARHGRTERATVMWGEAGHAYVFLIYGMHYCLNVVTERSGYPAAVLIRGAGTLNGPGKLTRYLHITRAQNQLDLAESDKLFIVDDGFKVAPRDIITTPRIGVDYAGEHALLPWRYLLKMG